jgi:spore germination protein YaaH
MEWGNLFNKVGKMALIGIITFSIFNFIQPSAAASKLNMSYLYFGKTSSFIGKIDETKGALNTVAPSYFDLNEDGTLDAKVDPLFVQEMHKRNIKVVPFLSNHWDREKGRKALSNNEVVVRQIVDQIKLHNLDGVNVDLENLDENDRDAHTEFMRLLKEQMPKGKEISIAVAANPMAKNHGWQGSYDYAALAQYSDYLMLMTYDESYFGSAPGPVASIPFVEKSLEYALERVPANKIVLGIPFYGRYWQEGKSKGGYGIPAYQAEDLAKQFKGIVTFDDTSKSPYATFTIKETDPLPKVHGRTLQPGTYTVWYENELSIKHKLRLIQKYNLRGTGSWSLTEIQADTWDYYPSWLNGEHHFVDAEHHWAEQDIMAVNQNGWMIGTSESSFSPQIPLTRAQATVILVRALGLMQGQGVDQNPTGTRFTDVSSSYWAAKEVEIANKRGIVEGIKAGKFAPDQMVSREQMAAMITRAYGMTTAVGQAQTQTHSIKVYQDISAKRWSYPHIMTLSNQKLMVGSEPHLFRPQDQITRAEMATLMNRVYKQFEQK